FVKTSGEWTIAKHVLDPAREIVPPKVTCQAGRQLGDMCREFFQRSPTQIRRAVVREDEGLRVDDRHVEVLRPMAHVLGQARCQSEPTYVAVRLFSARQQRGFVCGEAPKQIR